MTTLENFIQQQTDDLRPLNTRIGELSWQVSIADSPALEQQLGEEMKQARLLLADKTRYDELSKLLKHTTEHDALLLRQATLLNNAFRSWSVGINQIGSANKSWA